MARLPHRLAAAAVAALFLLAAAAAGAQERLVWWHSLPDEALAAYRPFLDGFQRDTGIAVELRFVAPSRLFDELSVAQALGVPPDVVSVAAHAGEPLAERGAFVDLAARILADPDFVDFFPAGLQLWRTARGSHYAVPVDLDVQALYYNHAAFASRGIAVPSDIDWEEWRSLAFDLSEDRDLDGALDAYGLTDWWFEWISLVWANGGEVFGPSGAIALSSRAAREAIDYYRSLVASGLLPGVADARRLGYAHPGELFKAGRVAMAPAGRWMPRHWAYDPWSGTRLFEIGVAPLPRARSGGRASPLFGTGLAIPTGSQRVAAAWALIKRLISPEALAAQEFLGVPARISVAGEGIARSESGASEWQVFIGALAYARPFPQGVDWWEGTGAAVMDALGRYARGEISYDGALAELTLRLGRPVIAGAEGGASLVGSSP